MNQDLFVTGTDTNVGKTVLSALLCAALDGVYWKPIQTGASESLDRLTVMKWAEISEEKTVPESYCFEPPVSPHLAAEACGISIDLSRIHLPRLESKSPLIVEGAGGVLVPLNERETMLDLMCRLKLPVMVAARTALGTINHTLLTLNALRNAGLTVRGVVLMGEENKDNLRSIEAYGKAPVIGEVPPLKSINRHALTQVFEMHFRREFFE